MDRKGSQQKWNRTLGVEKKKEEEERWATYQDDERRATDSYTVCHKVVRGSTTFVYSM